MEKEENYQFRYVVLSISYDALLYQIWSEYTDYQHLLSLKKNQSSTAFNLVIFATLDYFWLI